MTVLALDDAALFRLAARPEAVALVPALAGLAGVRRPRSCCGGGDGRAAQAVLAAKRAVASLSAPRRAELKALLGVETVAVRYREGDRVVEARL